MYFKQFIQINQSESLFFNPKNLKTFNINTSSLRSNDWRTLMPYVISFKKQQKIGDRLTWISNSLKNWTKEWK